MNQLMADKLKHQIYQLSVSCKCGTDHRKDEHIVFERQIIVGPFRYTQTQILCYGGITSGKQCECTQFKPQIGPLELWKMSEAIDHKVRSTELAINLSKAAKTMLEDKSGKPKLGVRPSFQAGKRPKGKRHKAKSESQVPYKTRQGYKREDSVVIDKFSKPD